jgi:hypothetical protein
MTVIRYDVDQNRYKQTIISIRNFLAQRRRETGENKPPSGNHPRISGLDQYQQAVYELGKPLVLPTRHSRLHLPVIPACTYPSFPPALARHSREGGNPGKEK